MVVAGINYLFPTLLTTKLLNLSQLNTMIYLMESPTLPAIFSCPCIRVMNPSSKLIMLLRSWGPSFPVSVRGVPPRPTIHLWFCSTQKIKDAFLSGTSVRRVHTVFMTCVSLILMHPNNSIGIQINASRWQRNRENGNIWRRAFSNAGVFYPLFDQLTASWGHNPRQHWRGSRVASHKSGGNPTLGNSDNSIVVFPSLWYGSLTSVSGSFRFPSFSVSVHIHQWGYGYGINLYSLKAQKNKSCIKQSGRKWGTFSQSYWEYIVRTPLTQEKADLKKIFPRIKIFSRTRVVNQIATDQTI